ncbi:MAG: DNA topoisomerase I [Candidatus Raskinella chloraquaticus]|uniref:DNA topoisomerase 1 n=1 Tax=Candidatus Raskinella chloraquaticus TaxID=1951219 RepID=A0A1W9I5F9_9HYPH|nr:MAG: DNA topoisomerase I [Proteobacteria bacterium SG_bin8]
MTKLLIVESPAKAKTINKYLGQDYTVLASYGHVRDLPAKDGSVRPEEDFAMDWEEGERAGRPLGDIARAAKAASTVLLATDPDREGEAIAWHVSQFLEEKGLNQIPIRRVTFNEITKSAVQKAIENPRDLDQNLIDAYLARRGLDYLFGFRLSPVLWRKLPGSKSAGRVQSVTLRLICEREAEIERFVPREYWSVLAALKTPAGLDFRARLFALDGKKLDKFAINDAAEAERVKTLLTGLSFAVAEVEKRQLRRNPPAPFTTSTLQQEASRKLGFGATRTMRTAQQLYEGVDLGGETVGLITYMRTDGVSLSAEAMEQTRRLIGSDFGKDYLPAAPRLYKTQAKNAQEAHEAIRPTDLFRRPETVAHALDEDQRRLYQLIWQRTVASQMESAILDQVTADLKDPAGKATLRATGTTVQFDGFQRAYEETQDEKPADDEDESSARLPPLKTGDGITRQAIETHQHFTEPPPRYSEASLVKKLEELGIGRPSTYASIMQTLQDRKYVVLDKRRFVPEDRGVVVTSFLTNFFERYVEYDFTAGLETQLDDVSDGRLRWKKLLADFWRDFSAALDDTKDLKVSDVLNVLDEKLGPHFFPARTDGKNPRACPACADGRLGLKLGRFGAFLGCANYPNCNYTRPLAVASPDGAPAALGNEGPKLLGQDPATGLPVTLRAGPYGIYLQLGPKPAALPETPQPAIAEEDGKKKKKRKKAADTEKPKRVSVPKGMNAQDITLEQALQLLSLPREVGPHPETGEIILAGIGRFGPYLKLGNVWKTLAADDDVLSIGLNRAVVLLAEAKAKGGGRGAAAGKPLGDHPSDGKPVTIHTGRYGPYVKWGKILANLPKGRTPDEFTLAEAIETLAAKAAKTGKGEKPTKTMKAKKPAAEETGTAKAPKKTGGTAKNKKAKKTA